MPHHTLGSEGGAPEVDQRMFATTFPWMLLGVAWLVARLPLGGLYWLGARLGGFIYRFGRNLQSLITLNKYVNQLNSLAKNKTKRRFRFPRAAFFMAKSGQ